MKSLSRVASVAKGGFCIAILGSSFLLPVAFADKPKIGSVTHIPPSYFISTSPAIEFHPFTLREVGRAFLEFSPSLIRKALPCTGRRCSSGGAVDLSDYNQNDYLSNPKEFHKLKKKSTAVHYEVHIDKYVFKANSHQVQSSSDYWIGLETLVDQLNSQEEFLTSKGLTLRPLVPGHHQLGTVMRYSQHAADLEREKQLAKLLKAKHMKTKPVKKKSVMKHGKHPHKDQSTQYTLANGHTSLCPKPKPVTAAGPNLGNDVILHPVCGNGKTECPQESDQTKDVIYAPPTPVDAAKQDGDPLCLYGPPNVTLSIIDNELGNECLGSIESGLFGVALCFDAHNTAESCGPSNSNSIFYKNSPSVKLSLRILDQPLDLLRASSYEAYSPDSGFTSGPPVVTIPYLDNLQLTTSWEQSFVGPSAEIPLGITLLEIKSDLTAGLDFTNGDQKWGAPAKNVEPPASCETDASGYVQALLAGNAHADVDLTGDISIIAASAGVIATLHIINDTAGVSVLTEIVPKQNSVTSTGSLFYDMHHLAGDVKAFVQVSYGFGSSEYDIELFHEDGINRSDNRNLGKQQIYSAKPY